MPNEYRYSALEFRQSADGLGTVAGTIIRYGDVAKIGRHLTEEFTTRALETALASDRIFANRMHQPDQLLGRVGQNFMLDNTAERLAFELTLPDTTAGRDTSYELREGILGAASIEFNVVKEEYRGNHRIVQEAQFVPSGGFAIVTIGAYPDSIVSMKRWAEYRDVYGLRPIEPEGQENGNDRSAETTNQNERAPGEGERPSGRHNPGGYLRA